MPLYVWAAPLKEREKLLKKEKRAKYVRDHWEIIYEQQRQSRHRLRQRNMHADQNDHNREEEKRSDHKQ